MEEEIAAMIVRLTGDATSYVKMCEQATSQAKQSATQIQAYTNQVESFGGGLKGFAASAVSALGALGTTGLLKEAFGNFAEAEGISLKLDAILASNGRNVQAVRKDYEAWAATMESLTTAEDDAVLKMLATAETLGLTGDAAKRATQNALALAAARDIDAQSAMRLTVALEQGRSEMLGRLLPALRLIKNDTERAAAAQKMLAGMFSVAEAEAKSSSGQLKILRRDWGNLLEDFGKVVAEGIKPVVEWLGKATYWLRSLSAETKQTITMIAAATAGFLALGPALMLAKVLLGPLTALIPVLTGALAFLLTPMGLVTAAIVTLGVSTLGWSETGGKALTWFGQQWDSLLTHIQPAIDGIKNALAGKDLTLAFQIAWVQIKLSFATATQSLREMWIGLTFMFQSAWANTVAFLQTEWNTATTNFAKGMNLVSTMWSDWISSLNSRFENFTSNTARGFLVLGYKLGIISKEEGADLLKAIDDANSEGLRRIAADREAAMSKGKAINDALSEDLQKSLARIEADRQAALNAANDAGVGDMQKIQDELKALEQERAKLLEDAAKVAEEAEKVKPPELPDIKPPEMPDAEMKIVAKFDAASFHSAEAMARVAAFRDTLTFATDKAGKAGGPSPVVKQFDAVQAGSAEAATRKEKSEDLLKKIEGHLAVISKKPAVELEGADL